MVLLLLLLISLLAIYLGGFMLPLPASSFFIMIEDARVEVDLAMVITSINEMISGPDRLFIVESLRRN